jgi:hypothetical protein
VTHHAAGGHRAVIPLGRAPRPLTGTDLAERLRCGLAEVSGAAIQGLDRLRLDAILDGPDVPALVVDLTGLAVRVGPASAGSTAPPAELLRREAGVVHSASLTAHPLTVSDVAVDVEAVVDGLRISWLELVDGSVAVELQEPTSAYPVSGQVRVGVDHDRLVEAVRQVAATTLAAQGLALSSLDVRLASHGPTSVAVVADARVRKGMVSATARVAATAEVSDDLVLTVRDVEATSRNPLVAAALVAFRSRLEAVERQRVDISAALPAAVRVKDLRLDVGDDLVLSARLV